MPHTRHASASVIKTPQQPVLDSLAPMKISPANQVTAVQTLWLIAYHVTASAVPFPSLGQPLTLPPEASSQPGMTPSSMTSSTLIPSASSSSTSSPDSLTASETESHYSAESFNTRQLWLRLPIPYNKRALTKLHGRLQICTLNISLPLSAQIKRYQLTNENQSWQLKTLLARIRHK